MHIKNVIVGKRTMLVAGGIGLLVLGLLASLQSLFADYCSDSCWNAVNTVAPFFFSFIPLFFLSLSTYRMRDEVFRAWSRFVLLWIPLSTVLLYLSPRDADMFTDFSRQSNAWRLTILFALISVLIVTYTWWANRKQ